LLLEEVVAEDRNTAQEQALEELWQHQTLVLPLVHILLL
jgi:hypothetical protein